jgi:dTDP-3-amino-3,4,6-trideoxy-alpha-D-glucose transaminase
LTIAPSAVEAAITARSVAILPVHLYGQPADMPAIAAIATKHHLAVVEDCCQAHVATCEGRPVGSFGAAAAYSFYPTKNLGALGDGGAITFKDAALASRARRIRNGGQIDKYHHQEFGVNSRLDELQAAILRARLPYLPSWTNRRRTLAAKYRSALAGSSSVVVPPELDAGHVNHHFPVLSENRGEAQARLTRAGFETLVHYPVPISRQPALLSEQPRECPVTERVCSQVFSLPLYPSMDDRVVSAVSEVLR